MCARGCGYVSSYQLHQPVNISSVLNSRPLPLPASAGLACSSPALTPAALSGAGLLAGLLVGVPPPPPTPPPPGGGVGVKVKGWVGKGTRASRCSPTVSMYSRNDSSTSAPLGDHTTAAQSENISPPIPSASPRPSLALTGCTDFVFSLAPPRSPGRVAPAAPGAGSSAPSQLACRATACVHGSSATRPNCSRCPRNPRTSCSESAAGMLEPNPATSEVNMSL